eukprot:scaffold113617_cov63-Phaeocystis_antarctica.AAC.4
MGDRDARSVVYMACVGFRARSGTVDMVVKPYRRWRWRIIFIYEDDKIAPRARPLKNIHSCRAIAPLSPGVCERVRARGARARRVAPGWARPHSSCHIIVIRDCADLFHLGEVIDGM